MLDISAIELQLKAKQAELEVRLRNVNHDLQRKNGPLSQDFAEQATEAENDEVMDVIAQETEAELQQVKHAISRLKKGEYSQCEICGEEINHARLKALPYTAICINCADS